MNSNKSSHILSTSSNLLGFCFVVLTSIRISNTGAATIIDDITGVTSVLLAASCILSFLSLRSTHEVRAARLEGIADIVFLIALVCIAITILTVSLNLLA